MPYIFKYTVKQNKLKRADIPGWTLDGDNGLLSVPSDNFHYVFLPVFDCGVIDGKWGRLSFDAELAEEMNLRIHAVCTNESHFIRKEVLTDTDRFMCDPEVAADIKLAFCKASDAVVFNSLNDILLYELSGRYLWIVIAVEGEGSARISNIRINNPGDTFMNVFPEVYHDWNGFFHRYLSVMSSLFNDFQQKIDDFGNNLDIATAPAELLEIYAGWIGIDVSGNFLDADTLRTIVKEGPDLNRRKGTRIALERICEIMLNEKCIIVEKKMAEDAGAYGSSIFDVTILVKTYVDEKKKAQLFFLLKQFVPVRSHLRIIYLASRSELDTHNYLDINASIYNNETGSLDEHMSLDGKTVLE